MYFCDLCMTPFWLSLSLQKVRNFAHFLGIFKYRIHHEILNLFEYSLFALSASTDKVRPRSLRCGLSALGSGGRSFEEDSHLYFTYLKKKEVICVVLV